MRGRWWIASGAIWIGGVCLFFLLGGLFGFEDIGETLSLWLVLPIPALLVWRIVEFALGIRDGYTGAERSYRQQTGRCAECGYSLHGNVSDVCPECGTPVTHSIKSAIAARTRR